MTSTPWHLSEVELDTHTTNFVSQNGMAIPIQPYELTDYPASGVQTSVSDLSRFFIALLNEGTYQGTRILDAKMAAEMTRFNSPMRTGPRTTRPGRATRGSSGGRSSTAHASATGQRSRAERRDAG